MVLSLPEAQVVSLKKSLNALNSHKEEEQSRSIIEDGLQLAVLNGADVLSLCLQRAQP